MGYTSSVYPTVRVNTSESDEVKGAPSHHWDGAPFFQVSVRETALTRKRLVDRLEASPPTGLINRLTENCMMSPLPRALLLPIAVGFHHEF